MTKPTKWHVRPAKTQISLGIHPVWSESSLFTLWVAKDPMLLHADSEDSDQTQRKNAAGPEDRTRDRPVHPTELPGPASLVGKNNILWKYGRSLKQKRHLETFGSYWLTLLKKGVFLDGPG